MRVRMCACVHMLSFFPLLLLMAYVVFLYMHTQYTWAREHERKSKLMKQLQIRFTDSRSLSVYSG